VGYFSDGATEDVRLTISLSLKTRFIIHFRTLELEAMARGDDLRYYARCAVCKVKIIPSHNRDGIAYYFKNKCYHQDCGENYGPEDLLGPDF
jgi:hypothetical protein